jgi:hypothetical protein
MKIEATMAGNERASPLPSWQGWDELIGSRQFDVDVQSVFQFWQTFEESFWFRVCFEVNVNGHLAPAHQNGGNASGKVDASFRCDCRPEAPHEPFDPFFCGMRSHRSMMTPLADGAK